MWNILIAENWENVHTHSSNLPTELLLIIGKQRLFSVILPFSLHISNVFSSSQQLFGWEYEKKKEMKWFFFVIQLDWLVFLKQHSENIFLVCSETAMKYKQDDTNLQRTFSHFAWKRISASSVSIHHHVC